MVCNSSRFGTINILYAIMMLFCVGIISSIPIRCENFVPATYYTCKWSDDGDVCLMAAHICTNTHPTSNQSPLPSFLRMMVTEGVTPCMTFPSPISQNYENENPDMWNAVMTLGQACVESYKCKGVAV